MHRSQLLSNPRLLTLVLASALSSLGTGIISLAFTYVSYQISGSLVVAVLVISMQALPAVFLIKVAQWLPQRFSLRSINIVTQLAYALMCVVGAIFLGLGYLSITLLVLLSLTAGVISALAYPAWNQMLRAIAPKPAGGSSAAGLVQLDAALQAGNSLAGVVGLLLGGVLLTQWGIGWLFVIDAISYLFPVIAIVLLGHVARPDKAEGQSSIWQALGFLWGHVKLRRIVLAAVALNLVAWPILRVLPGMATDINASPTTFSILISGFYAGAGLTPLLISRWRKSVGYEGVFARSVILLLGTFLLMWATAGVSNDVVHIVILVILLAGMGLGINLAITVLDASVQVAAPDATEAGLLAAYSAIITVTYPIGGLLVAGIGGRQGVWLAIGFQVVGVALLFGVTWWRIGPDLKVYTKVDVGNRILSHHSRRHHHVAAREAHAISPAAGEPSEGSGKPVA